MSVKEKKMEQRGELYDSVLFAGLYGCFRPKTILLFVTATLLPLSSSSREVIVVVITDSVRKGD